MAPDEDNIDPDLRKILQIPDDQELPPDALCDVMIRALESPQLLLRSSAVHQLIDLGKNYPEMAIPKILAALDPSIDYWTVRFGCVEALGDIADPRVIKPLMEYLRNDSDPDFRAMVAKQLGEMGSKAKDAGDALIEVLKDKESPEIRENAAYAIGKIKVYKASKALCEALELEKDEYAKRQMCWALGELADPSGIEILVKKLKDSDKETRASAAEALGKIKHPDVVFPLLKATQDSEVEVQTKAIKSLKAVEDDVVISEIEKASKGDILLAIQYYDEYLFNIENDNISKRLKEIKDPIINEYRDE
ncbi:MAG: HEAT repeat domain-containing protein, partial [Candidatus Hodarchaeales archaeon]